MSDAAVLAGAFAVAVVGLVAVAAVGLTRSWLTGTLCALALPVPVWQLAEPTVPHFGITMGTVTVMTYTLPVLGLYAASLRRSASWRLHLLPAVTLLWLVGLTLWVWGADELVVSGILHLMTALLAFVAAALLIRGRDTDAGLLGWLALSATLVLLVEALFVLFQRAGYPLSLQPEIGYYLSEGRALGTFDHPTTLGKFGLMLLVLLLPGTTSGSTLVRRSSWFGVGLAVVTSGLTLSRANTLAIVAAVLVWIVIQRRDAMSGRARIVSIAAVVAVSAPAVALAMARFRIDSGGERAHFWAVGMPYVREYFFTGLGSNSYVEIVGATDWRTAEGYPIHNAFVLMLAEVGLVGAALLFVPLVATVALAIRRFRDAGASGAYARALLAFLPGVLLVAMTGWGMIASSTFVLWYLVMGVAWGAMTTSATSVADELNYGGARSFKRVRATPDGGAAAEVARKIDRDAQALNDR